MSLAALQPAGPAAAHVAWLSWLFLGACGLVYLATMAGLAAALRRGLRPAEPTPTPAVGRESGRAIIVTLAALATVFVLTIFVGASFMTDRALLDLERDPALEIELTAHQWWWEIRYRDSEASKIVTTANELHLPVNRRAKISLASGDVIHSVWIPNLAGKRDIIPGRDNEIWLTAEKAGAWRGRCAEFCGYQHAQMDLLVIAESPEQFELWRAAQIAPAAAPSTPEAELGQRVFREGACIICHAVRGASGSGASGSAPDLTHLKSRSTIAAGAAPNARGYLAGWVADPQGLKPGANMPSNMLPPDRFQALVAYLETLR